ncbi:hypothetical protein AAG906_013745 [Vitis piasezkii]
MRDICILEEKMLRDPKRLYAPSRLYHIVEIKLFRMGRFPPVMRTVVPVDGRFEHVVLHAPDLILGKDKIMEIPAKQKMDRHETLKREYSEEYKAALQMAVTLTVPRACSPSQCGTFSDHE